MTDLATWPPEWPSFILSKYNYKNDPALLRTAMSGGAPKQRQQFTQVPTKYNVTFIMGLDDYQYFRAFFNFVLKEGQDYFYVDLDTDGFLRTESARFIGPYKSQKTSDTLWTITSILEVAFASTNFSGELAEYLTKSGMTVEDAEAMAIEADDMLEFQALLT